MDRLLESVPFRHPERAQRNLAGLDPFLNAETRDILHPLLAQSPDPDAALDWLERYLSLAGRLPEGGASCLSALVAVFAHSHFLSETLFQHPDVIGWALEHGELYRVLPADELRAQLGRLPIGKMDRPAVAFALARFKRRNLLRILLRDVLGRAALAPEPGGDEVWYT